jgi:mono/diheme cytochrome c family protein
LRQASLLLRIPAAASLMLCAACGDPMYERGRLRPLDPTPFFPDGTTARRLVPGTVPRDEPATAVTETRQKFANLEELPVPLTRRLLERGREGFEIFCSVCHGSSGHGDGMVVRRGFTPPPPFHIERLRTAPIGHFVDVVTNGFGAMYSYADRVPLADRWAIAAYVRALQLSQHAPVSLLSPEEIERLPEEAR